MFRGHRINRFFLLSAGAGIGLAAATIVIALTVSRDSSAESRAAMTGFPRLVLWAWERPEDLSFIDVNKVGVAYLAETIRLDGGAVSVLPRRQPLKIPDGTALIAVVRIEALGSLALNSSQAKQIVDSVTTISETHGVKGVQIDFDAAKSQRDFYRSLLTGIRQKLPPGMPLSMTALASWCIYDDWLTGLPVDEAVPMVFRMGADRLQVLSRLESGADFRSALARDSVGISVDEKLDVLPRGRRIFVFNPKPWSQEAVQETIKEVNQWQ